jgi:hypothetical protein
VAESDLERLRRLLGAELLWLVERVRAGAVAFAVTAFERGDCRW